MQFPLICQPAVLQPECKEHRTITQAREKIRQNWGSTKNSKNISQLHQYQAEKFEFYNIYVINISFPHLFWFQVYFSQQRLAGNFKMLSPKESSSIVHKLRELANSSTEEKHSRKRGKEQRKLCTAEQAMGISPQSLKSHPHQSVVSH